MKKVISLLLALLLLCSALPVSAAGEEIAIAVGTVNAQKGQSVSVPITISGNTGICGARFAIAYSQKLKLTGVDKGMAFSSLTLTKPGDFSANPIYLVWDGMDADSSNGVIATLTFTVPQESGTFEITASYEEGDITDGDLQEISPAIQNGSVIIPNIIESVALFGTVTTPVKNLADSSGVTGNGVQAAVTWSPALAGGRFAQNTVYTATITVSPAPGARFADAVAFSPFDGFTTFKKGSDGSYSATKTFPRTSDKDAPTAEVPTGLTAVFGDTLGSVTLTNPAGNTAGSWNWKEGTDALVGPAGVQSHIAVFTPEDSANYAVVEKPVSITVTKQPVEVPAVSGTPIPYDGKGKSIPWQSAPDSQYVETDDQTTGTNAGEYQAVVRLKDKNNTEWAGEGNSNDKSFRWSIAPKELTEYTVEILPSAYDYTGDPVVPKTVQVKDGTVVLSPSEYQLSYESNIQAGTTAAVVVRDVPGGNYVLSEKKQTFIINKIPGILTVHQPAALVYEGTAVTCGKLGEGEFDIPYQYTGDGTVTVKWYSADGTEELENAPVNAGTYQIGIAVVEGTNYQAISEQRLTFTISALQIPQTAIDAISGYTAAYDGAAHDAVVTDSGADGYTLRYSLTEDGDYTSTCPTVTNVTDNTTVWVELSRENYVSCKLSVVTNVTRAELDPVPAVSLNGWKYGETPENPSVTGNLGNGAVTYRYYTNADCTQGESTIKPQKVGEYWVKAFIAESANYNAAVTEAARFQVGKGDPLVLEEMTMNQKYTVTAENWKDISKAMPADAGSQIYTKRTEIATGTVAVSAWDISAEGILTFSLTGGAVGDTVTFPVTISSESYEDSTLNVKAMLIEKEVPTVHAENITVTYLGAPIEKTMITGTAEWNGEPVPGTWDFAGTYDLTNANRGIAVTVCFTPDDLTEFAEQTDTITLTINKALPSGEPTFTRITSSGKTLAETGLAVGSISPAGGTIRWDMDPATVVSANTAYTWTYTPGEDDERNYSVLTGSITPYTVSVPIGPSVPEPTVETVTTETGNTATITTQPEGDKTIEVKAPSGETVAGIELPANPGAGKKFSDVKAGSWYEDSVDKATAYSLFNGTSETTFSPNGKMNRGMVAQVLYNLSGKTKYGVGSGSFTDVASGKWYKDAVDWASKAGVVNGISESLFAPDRSVTREQLVTMLYRYAKAIGADTKAATELAGFPDGSKVSSYAGDAMKWAVANGFIGGRAQNGKNYIAPGGTATRAEVAAILTRFVEFLKK